MIENPRRWLLLILGIYLILTMGYGIVNPLFEAPDEHNHYFTAQFITDTGRLPAVSEESDPLVAQEAGQPPLYYLAAAAIIKPFDTNDARESIWLNPRVELGNAGAPNNINAFVHGPQEAWPWQGFVLPAHLIRMFSALLGVGTLICIYGSGRLVWPQAAERALLATAMVAFLPQFNFLHGSMSNDTLIILLTAAALWQLVVMWVTKITTGRLILISILIGLAILSKMAGLLLLIYATGFLGILAWRDNKGRGWQELLKAWLKLVLVPGIAILLSGWLLWRNWQLYGDITATSVFIEIAGGDRAYTLWQVLKEWPGLWLSIFAIFGWFNVRTPQWVYYIWNGIVVAAIIGTVWGVARDSKAKEKNQKSEATKRKTSAVRAVLDWPGLLAVLLGAWVVLVYGGLVNFMLKTPAAQGRLLFPALLPLALGVAYGLSRIRWRGIYLLAPTLALVTTLTSLFFVIPGAYALPEPIIQSQIPPEATDIFFDLGEGVEIAAAEIETEVAEPGEQIALTIYWRAKQGSRANIIDESSQYVLEVFGSGENLIGKFQSYHGGGLYPAGLWTPGEIIPEDVLIHLDEDIMAPVQARLNVKLAGSSRSVDIGAVKVSPSEWPVMSDKVIAQLNGIELVEAQLEPTIVKPGEPITIVTHWQVQNAPGRDLTTFVHLGDPFQIPLAQGDSPPRGGSYPTSLWAAGEVIDDRYQLIVPDHMAPGEYPLIMGMYDPESGVRLPLSVAGERQVNDAYLVGIVSVSE